DVGRQRPTAGSVFVARSAVLSTVAAPVAPAIASLTTPTPVTPFTAAPATSTAVAAAEAAAGAAIATAAADAPTRTAAATPAATAATATRSARGYLALELGPHQVDLAAVVDVVDLHAELVALLEEVLDALHALLGDLADVQQPVGAGEEVDEGAEVGDLGDRAVVLLANLGAGGEGLDLLAHRVGGLGVLRVDAHGAVLADLDGCAHGLELADLLAARPDDGADLVGRDLDLE